MKFAAQLFKQKKNKIFNNIVYSDYVITKEKHILQ